MESEFVSKTTCVVLHDAADRRIDRMEKDTEKQWAIIEDIRKDLQKQAVKIATIVGGVSAVVQLLSFVAQYVTIKH